MACCHTIGPRTRCVGPLQDEKGCWHPGLLAGVCCATTSFKSGESTKLCWCWCWCCCVCVCCARCVCTLAYAVTLFFFNKLCVDGNCQQKKVLLRRGSSLRRNHVSAMRSLTESNRVKPLRAHTTSHGQHPLPSHKNNTPSPPHEADVQKGVLSNNKDASIGKTKSDKGGADTQTMSLSALMMSSMQTKKQQTVQERCHKDTTTITPHISTLDNNDDVLKRVYVQPSASTGQLQSVHGVTAQSKTSTEVTTNNTTEPAHPNDVNAVTGSRERRRSSVSRRLSLERILEREDVHGDGDGDDQTAVNSGVTKSPTVHATNNTLNKGGRENEGDFSQRRVSPATIRTFALMALTSSPRRYKAKHPAEDTSAWNKSLDSEHFKRHLESVEGVVHRPSHRNARLSLDGNSSKSNVNTGDNSDEANGCKGEFTSFPLSSTPNTAVLDEDISFLDRSGRDSTLTPTKAIKLNSGHFSPNHDNSGYSKYKNTLPPQGQQHHFNRQREMESLHSLTAMLLYRESKRARALRNSLKTASYNIMSVYFHNKTKAKTGVVASEHLPSSAVTTATSSCTDIHTQLHHNPSGRLKGKHQLQTQSKTRRKRPLKGRSWEREQHNNTHSSSGNNNVNKRFYDSLYEALANEDDEAEGLYATCDENDSMSDLSSISQHSVPNLYSGINDGYMEIISANASDADDIVAVVDMIDDDDGWETVDDGDGDGDYNEEEEEEEGEIDSNNIDSLLVWTSSVILSLRSFLLKM
eukprot:m.226335 g.226335  ORF g.226335 m.226335 type:complete len:750 (+) comp13863_c5_seq15:2537-4786(+)